MSNIKRDLMKEIEAKVARKKQLAQQLSRQKTVANWVAEFFTEYENTRKVEKPTEYQFLAYMAINRLAIQLRAIDRKCVVDLRDSDGVPVVEIRWSAPFILANNCEEVLVLDASSAFFQGAIEDV